MPPFRRLLVANRGEIAVRVIRACRELGIESVAVFSEADAGALHVRLADRAVCCGPPPATQSYLDAEGIARLAREAGAEAVHPGYGFLSENPSFAEAVAAEGLVFVGPAPAVMRRMGDKVTARRTMEGAGVPVVPGATARLSDAEAAAVARDLGLPVMVKASAGGGGRGLRLVREADELAAAIERARSEAEASFGDGGLYVEKWLEHPRHVEVQVLADRAGRCAHLFERECSVQRRHQKLVEEAPAPGLEPALRERMGAAAVAAAEAVGYEGAGTVEFLLDREGGFHFLEMNTRIQVEHGVTEAITGVDLVVAQIRIAAGEPLGLAPGEPTVRGHAIEARVYAEDPGRRFLPSPGRVLHWRAPSGPGVRVDAGVTDGSEVPRFYDPMIAKLVAWGADRVEALARLDGACAETQIGGVRTSLPFHRWLLRHPAFRAGAVHTGFVDACLAEGPVVRADPDLAELAAAVARRVAAGDPGLEATGPYAWLVDHAGGRREVVVTPARKGFDVVIDGQHFAVKD